MTPAGFRAIHGVSTSECEAPQPKPPVILALVAAESANRHRQRSGAHVLQMAVAYRPQVKPALRLTTPFSRRQRSASPRWPNPHSRTQDEGLLASMGSS